MSFLKREGHLHKVSSKIFRKYFAWNPIDFLKNKNNSDYWYIAGIFAADAYVTDYLIEFCLWYKDLEIIERIRDILCPDHPIATRKDSGAKLLKLDNKIMASHYKKLFSMKSNKKHLELELPEIPDKYLKDFFRGYFDGDGTVDSTKGYQTVQGVKKTYIGPRIRILGSKSFLTDLNHQTKNHVNHKTNAILKKGKYNVYVVTYNFSTARKLLDWMYSTESNLYLKRKKDIALEVHPQLKDIV